MAMEGPAKVDVLNNGNPLPQRQKNPQVGGMQNKNQSMQGKNPQGGMQVKPQGGMQVKNSQAGNMQNKNNPQGGGMQAKNAKLNQQKANESIEGAPAEKKQRFNAGGSMAGGGGPGNIQQNKGGPMNKGGFMGNRGGGGGSRGSGNRGNNMNRGNMQNQNQQNQQQQHHHQQQQHQQQQQQSDVKPHLSINQDAVNKDGGQAHQQQNQNNHQNRGGNRGGGPGAGGMGGGGGNRDRSRGTGGPQRGQGGGGQGGGGNFGRGDDFFIGQRLRAISGPTHELPVFETSEETKFSGRNRLYVGNLTNDISEEELREMFKPYGEIGEVFCNSEKNFTFLKLDYHANAEKAKRDLDGTMRKGRALRVRFAPNATILRVRNLTPFVSNELLYKAFEIFGPVERASVTVDDRGKPTGEGIVEFARKSAANACIRFCNDKCFFLTASLRPCVVEPFEANEDTDGLPEKSLNKKSSDFNHERNIGPRFADLGSFEHEYGTRWKQLHELYKTKKEALKRELKMEEEKLEAQMEYARYEHETELLRQELRKRESDNERKKIEWELREKQAEEMRKRDEENMHRQQSEMQTRMLRQEEEMRRRQQENTLFIQAQQLNSLLDQQEGGFGGGNGNGFDNFGGASNSPFDFRDALTSFIGNNNGGGANGGVGNGGGGGGNNGPNNQQEPFAFEFGGNNQSQGGGGGGGNQGNQRGNNIGGNNNNANSGPWERRRRF